MSDNYEITNEPLVVSKSIMDLFLSDDNPKIRSDLISLYMFYYYTAKWQRTNQPRATSAYTMKGLGWSKQRFRNAKKRLLQLKLIEDRTSREKSKDGKMVITGHYIYVRFIWSQNNALFTGPVFQPVKNRDINALSVNSINALSGGMDNSSFSSNGDPSKGKSNGPIPPYYGHRPSYRRLAEHIQSFQTKQYPFRYNNKTPAQLEKQIKDGIDTIDRLVRLDKFDFTTQIKPAIKWALKDEFWGKNIFAAGPLRNKGSNNETKFYNIYVQWAEQADIDPEKGRLPKKEDYQYRDMWGNVTTYDKNGNKTVKDKHGNEIVNSKEKNTHVAKRNEGASNMDHSPKNKFRRQNGAGPTNHLNDRQQ